MPSKTFYNLSEEKKKKIILAAKEEFSKKLYQEASLNQIIKESNISRGSFYMYFNDKEELYFYLLDEYKSKFEKIIKNTIEKNNGEVFSSFQEFFSIISIILKDKNYEFEKNIFKNMNYFIENQLLKKEPDSISEDYIYEYIDKEKLVLTKKEEILHLLHIIIMLSINDLTRLIHNPDDSEIVKKIYNDQLLLLKKAFYKGGK